MASLPRRVLPSLFCLILRCVPRVAGISALLGWHEREISDLFGLKFVGHPEPYRLVLHNGASPVKPPFDSAYPFDTPMPFKPAMVASRWGTMPMFKDSRSVPCVANQLAAHHRNWPSSDRSANQGLPCIRNAVTPARFVMP
jgi:hypothetical protein